MNKKKGWIKRAWGIVAIGEGGDPNKECHVEPEAHDDPLWS